MSEAPNAKLMTLADVCTRFKGAIGKTKLVAHLKAVPHFAGGPTHRKNGAKYLFTEEDVARIIESLAAVSDNSSRSKFQQEHARPSDVKAYELALKSLTSGTLKSERRSPARVRRQTKPTRQE